ncbi:MAG: FUSC family protein, partial [Phycisphaerales bacterium]|nr:FUSC family protein [Phycisphaerales bacterium]
MRTAAAGTIGAFLALWLGTGAAFWTLITVYILAMPDVGSSLIKVGNRLLGTLAGAALAVVMVTMFPQTPAGAFIFFLIAIGVTLYISHVTPMAAYAFYLCAVTVILVGTSAWYDPANMSDVALLRFTNIAVGVISVWLAWQFVWPVKAQQRLSEGLQERLDRADTRLSGMLDAIDTGSSESLARVSPGQSVLAAHIALLNSAAAESADIDRHRGAWLGAITLVDRFASQVAALEGQLRPADLKGFSSEDRAALRNALEFVRHNWSLAHEALLSRGRIETGRPNAEGHLAALEHLQQSGDIDGDRAALLATLIVLVKHVPQAHDLVQWIATGHEEPSLKVNQDGARTRPSLWAPFRQVDVSALKAAIKATLATGIALVLSAAFDWQDA